MFDANVSVNEVGGVGGDGGEGEVRFGWREIHRALRRIAKSKGELDAEELRWLARAERAGLHRELGMATVLEYVERVLGYGPKVGRDRLRVARKLEELPRMAAALANGELPFSAVRELSRFVVPETEEVWLEKARGKCLREIEDMARGRKRGSRPEDPVDPDDELRPITLDVSPTTLALDRDAVRRLEEEMGHPLTDDEALAVMCVTVLDHASRGASEETGDERAAPRVAPYQVAFTVCAYCERSCQDACGRSVDVPDSAVAMARSSRAWSCVAIEAVARCPAAARHASSISITSSIASTAERMNRRTSCAFASAITSRCIEIRSRSLVQQMRWSSICSASTRRDATAARRTPGADKSSC